MKNRKTPLTKSVRYRQFIEERDRALEILLTQTQEKVSDYLRECFTRALEIISFQYPRAKHSVNLLRDIDNALFRSFGTTIFNIDHDVVSLRRKAYLLAYAGEAEAIARALGKKLKVDLPRAKLSRMVLKPSAMGGSISDRIGFTLDKLRRRIVEQVQRAAIQDDKLEDLQAAVMRLLPAHKVLRRPRRTLKSLPIREADDDSVLGYVQKGNQMQPVTLTDGAISDEDWQDMVDSYKTDFVPVNRGPMGELDVQLGEGSPQYAWELEKEITQDFVQMVRDGQVDAANQNGYTDFVWIAVVDDKTDDCCLWRDGLTTKEIELALKTERKEDECDAVTPPAHFNCRCSIAPVTDELPETPPDSIGDFTAWLETH